MKRVSFGTEFFPMYCMRNFCFPDPDGKKFVRRKFFKVSWEHYTGKYISVSCWIERYAIVDTIFVFVLKPNAIACYTEMKIKVETTILFRLIWLETEYFPLYVTNSLNVCHNSVCVLGGPGSQTPRHQFPKILKVCTHRNVFLFLVKLIKLWLCWTIFSLFCNQPEFCLAPKCEENCKHNHISLK